jgi:hypothetical protein
MEDSFGEGAKRADDFTAKEIQSVGECAAALPRDLESAINSSTPFAADHATSRPRRR